MGAVPLGTLKLQYRKIADENETSASGGIGRTEHDGLAASMYFNSRPRVAGDEAVTAAIGADVAFQFTPARGGLGDFWNLWSVKRPAAT